jgi:phospholipid/cholesterol/gamma-HCH transport system substrate-binding protein
MAKQANRMMIGGFVVVAVILLAASLVVFGSGKFFKKTNKYVLYFDGSIKGLSVGGPVLFQGVQIGSVESIVLRVDPQEHRIEIPVIIEIEPDKFQVDEGDREIHRNPRENAQKLIEMGLRAMLAMQSFITGQLMIELDFHPGSPVNLRSPKGDLLEIPTIPSTTERLANALQRLDLEGMEKHLEDTLSGIDRLVNNPDLKAGIGELKGVISDARRLVQNMNARVGPLADEFDATVQDTHKLVQNLDGRVNPLADNVNKTVEDFGKLARDADTRLGSLTISLDKTLAGARGVLSQDAPLIVELENTLQAISDAARSIRQLADNLERHPEALIQGKGESGGK